jgi:predicted nucleic acid-binding Zn ribbon protein
MNVYHKMNERPAISCLACNANQDMAKIISQPAVHFKGVGFYETDYKRAG